MRHPEAFLIKAVVALAVMLVVLVAVAHAATAATPYRNDPGDPILRWAGNPSKHYRPVVRKGWKIECDSWYFTSKKDKAHRIVVNRCYETRVAGTA